MTVEKICTGEARNCYLVKCSSKPEQIKLTKVRPSSNSLRHQHLGFNG